MGYGILGYVRFGQAPFSVQHTRMSNGEEETLSFSFQNGRGIELRVFTLDSPDKQTHKRDGVTLDEILESPHFKK